MSADPGLGTVWRLAFPAPAPWLNANDRLPPHTRAKYTRLWRSRTYIEAIAVRLPKRLGRVRVDAVLRFPTRIRRDPPNFYPTVKACIDALGPPIVRITARVRQSAPGYELIPDDTAVYLDGPHITEGPQWTPPTRQPRLAPAIGCLELTITDLTEPDHEGRHP